MNNFQESCLKVWTQIASTEELNVCRNQFWQAVWIWNVKPNVVNRRLFACEVLHCFELPDPSHNFFDIDFNCDGIQCDQLENVIIHRIKEKLSVQECDESHAHLFSSKNYFLVKRIHLRNQKFSDFLEICFISKQIRSLSVLHILLNNNSRLNCRLC